MPPPWPTALPLPNYVVSAHRAGRDWFRHALSARELRSEDEQASWHNPMGGQHGAGWARSDIAVT
jgi:hypothetical protein